VQDLLAVYLCTSFSKTYHYIYHSHHRPSLSELRQHAFIANNMIPGSLPSTCTYSAPLWSTDEFGELQVVNPTSALDVNISNRVPASSALKSSEGNEQNAKPHTTSPNFQIYDDVNTHSTSKAAARDDKELNAQVASCRISDDEVRENPSAPGTSQDPKPYPAANPDEISELEKMYNNLEDCLTNFERIQNGGEKMKECETEMVEESKWVTRFVDYTSKYGLGFLLNDGR
jgi:hypothetical protein